LFLPLIYTKGKGFRMKLFPNSYETILEDDYPVFMGYAYIGDGELIESPIKGTVARLKQALNVKEVRRFDFQRDKR
jgi:hypothetical protein